MNVGITNIVAVECILLIIKVGPTVHYSWKCTCVYSHTQKRKGKPHPLKPYNGHHLFTL